MKLPGKGIQDILLFGRIVSLALLTGGYVFLGLLLGRSLVARGWGQWAGIAAPAAGACLGLWQAYSLLRGMFGKH